MDQQGFIVENDTSNTLCRSSTPRSVNKLFKLIQEEDGNSRRVWTPRSLKYKKHATPKLGDPFAGQDGFWLSNEGPNKFSNLSVIPVENSGEVKVGQTPRSEESGDSGTPREELMERLRVLTRITPGQIDRKSISNLFSKSPSLKKGDRSNTGECENFDLNSPVNVGLGTTLADARDNMTGKQTIRKLGVPIEEGINIIEPQLHCKTEIRRNEGFVIRTSESEPYAHQVEIPSAEQFLFHAKICMIMEEYDDLIINHNKSAENFDFSILTGLSNAELQAMFERQSNVTLPMASPTMGDVPKVEGGVFSEHKKKKSLDRIPVVNTLATHHEPTPAFLAFLLGCADDIIVEGTFCGSGNNTSDLGLEVTVFSSHRHRQYVVCYRGVPALQKKPFSLKPDTQKKIESKLFHSDYPEVFVNQTFRDSYFTGNLEDKVFALLNELSEKDPFCDVVMCGHSFGGALSCLGSVRYATLYPSTTVSCHAFGSPRVGGTSFRLLANSVPNLKIMRIEYGFDPYTNAPIESISSKAWTHAGHSIVISEDTPLSPPAQEVSTINSPAATVPNAPLAFKVHAYRFDNRRKLLKSQSWKGVNGLTSIKCKSMKKDHELVSYLNALEFFALFEELWVSRYIGEQGEGISGLNNEERCVV